jgi:membrane-bound serine protease (ClpP class)
LESRQEKIAMAKSNGRNHWLLKAICLLSIGLPISVAPAISAQENEIDNSRKERPQSFHRAVLIEFEGEINQRMLKYFRGRFNKAKRMRADLIIVEIYSPGGYLVESLEIANMLRDCDWAHTVAYIPQAAYSGAALVSFGCDETIIAKDASIGDIGVVEFDPTLIAFKYADAKARSVFVRQARDLASSKGRPPALVESMIDKDVACYYKVDANGKFEFKNETIVEGTVPPKKQDGWTLIEESKANRFLTVNGARAVELGLASNNAGDRDKLKRELNVDGPLNVQKYNAADSAAYWLAHPLITAVLIIVGLIALYLEVSAPGISAGGLIAGLCAILFFWSRFMGGTSGWLEVILFLAGVAFLLMEIFVIPGWGISGISGLALIFFSALLASQHFVWPQSPAQWNQTMTTSLVFVASFITVIIIAGVLTRKLGSIPALNKLVLSPHDDDAQPQNVTGKTKPKVTPHPIVSVGDWGKAETVLRPAGRARFERHSIDVVSEGSFIEPGRQIRVLSIEGNRIVVTAVEEDRDGETVYKNG